MMSDGSSRRNLHLYRLSPLVRTAETSILHLVVGKSCVALATSSNTLLLHRAGSSSGPPITRQVQWFSGALKGVASMAMRDDSDLLVVTHDASAFVLPLRFMLRQPPLPIRAVGAEPAESSEVEAPRGIAPPVAELVAVHGEQDHIDASVSCCTLCEMGGADGAAAAIGSLDGSLHLISLRRRCIVDTVDAGAPISRLWALPEEPLGGGQRRSASSGGSLLMRTLQGKYLLMSVGAKREGERTCRPLVLPRGELTVQRAVDAAHGPLLLLHCVDDARLLV
jgi:hypothetical protein